MFVKVMKVHPIQGKPCSRSARSTEMEPAAFAIWSILAIFTGFYLFNWIWKKRKYRNALLFNRKERAAMKAAPRIGVAWAAILIAFLVVNLDSMYLLVVFPLVYLFVNYQVGKKLKDEE
jgi:ABC-type Fe3+ transport system permease subunit